MPSHTALEEASDPPHPSSDDFWAVLKGSRGPLRSLSPSPRQRGLDRLPAVLGWEGVPAPGPHSGVKWWCVTVRTSEVQHRGLFPQAATLSRVTPFGRAGEQGGDRATGKRTCVAPQTAPQSLRRPVTLLSGGPQALQSLQESEWTRGSSVALGTRSRSPRERPFPGQRSRDGGAGGGGGTSHGEDRSRGGSSPWSSEVWPHCTRSA